MIDQGSPINWNSPLNAGLSDWWLCMPGATSGAVLRNLCRPTDLRASGHGVLTNITPSASRGISAPTRVGGFGQVGLDGTNNQVVVSPCRSVGLPFSVGCSVYFNSISDFTMLVAHNTALNVNTGWRVQVQTGSGFGFTLAGVADYSFGITLAAGKWYHMLITASANGGTATGHLLSSSGYQTGSASIGTMTGTPDKMYVGTYENQILFLSGYIDNITLFNRCLGADQAKQRLYEAQTFFPKTLNRVNRFWKNYAVPPAAGGATTYPWHYYQMMGVA